MFNTMKRKMFFRLAVVCVMAASALIACTKDYGSDIKALQDDVDGLRGEVGDLRKMITEDGCVIKEVNPVEGGTEVVLSNGKKFTVLNGAKGDNGKDGTVWKIGDNGNWWSSTEGKPFEDSGMKAQGPKGDTGKSAYEASGFAGSEAEWIASLKGADGKSAYEIAKENDPAVANLSEAEWVKSLKGDKGDDGKNGDYFYPCVNKNDDRGAYKHWVRVDGTTGDETVLDDLWFDDDSVLYAVWDEASQTITFHNVRDAEDGIVEISLAIGLNSIALIPEMWDASLGMPTAQVYAIMPTPWETFKAIYNRSASVPRYMEFFDAQGGWAGIDPKKNLAGMNFLFWCSLYNSYLGINGWTQWYYGYDPEFDVYYYEGEDNGEHYKYPWQDVHTNASEGYTTELTYADFANAVKDCIADMGKRLEKTGDINDNTYFRQTPVSALNLKYRINPAGADISGYKFNMLDRSLQVVYDDYYEQGRKAEGDKRASAVAKLETEMVGKDQLNVTGYINYFKYWADKPDQFWLMVMMSKAANAWDYWDACREVNMVPKWYSNCAAYMSDDIIAHDDAAYTIPNPDGDDPARVPYNHVQRSMRAMREWFEAQGMKYETILALEAARTNAGSEAIVSDYTAVKMDFVTPVWTAYNHRFQGADNITARWRMATTSATFAYYDAMGEELDLTNPYTYENDYLVVGQTYDVPSHMRFADTYYGRLEDLGFEVEYDFYVYEEKNSESHPYNDGKNWADHDDNPCGETETNYGGWDKVTCTKDGKVTVKKDGDNFVSGAIGKYVIITADAKIKNNATDTWYTSSTSGHTTPYYMKENEDGGYDMEYYMNDRQVDEFAGHYVLLIVPDSSKALQVKRVLGTFAYLDLPKSGLTAPAPLKSLRPANATDADWAQALDMDWEGFTNIYNIPESPSSTIQKGYSAVIANDPDMFSITLDNKARTGTKNMKYTFEPKEEFKDKYPELEYTIEWTVTMDWTAVEPILNPDYILYKEDAEGNKIGLEPTDIKPDPVTKYAEPRAPYGTGSFPYVDTVILVKGKRIVEISEHGNPREKWAPQASIRENLYKYGVPLYDIPNVADISMSINYANSGKDESSAKLWVEGSSDHLWSFDLQEIKQLTPFAAGELSRDYVIDIKVKLANSETKVVKAYILRFVCPMYLKIVDTDPNSKAGDIDLYTHLNDCCSDQTVFEICETDSGLTLVTFTYWEDGFGIGHFRRNVTTHAVRTYGRDFYDRIGRAKWHAEGDGTFGGNLSYEEYNGWFYWDNDGNSLREDKFLPYTVQIEIDELATMEAEGLVYVHKSVDSPVDHNMEEPDHPSERRPRGNDIPLPVYETVFED